VCAWSKRREGTVRFAVFNPVQKLPPYDSKTQKINNARE